jgi:hypothetical protein
MGFKCKKNKYKVYPVYIDITYANSVEWRLNYIFLK